MILHDGSVVFEAYDRGLTPHAPHIIMSATKSIVGLVAGILQGAGDLDVDAPATRYLPEMRATDEPRTVFAMGIHGQNLFVDQANRLVIAKLSSQHSPVDPGAMALTHRAVAEIRRCLTGP